MKINDVVTLMEFGAPGSRSLGTGNFALLHRAYVNKRPRLSRYLQLDFGNNQIIELDDDDIEAVANYYDTLPTDQDRYTFVYDVMSRGDKFDALLKKLGRRSGAPEQPSLLERDSNTDLDRGSVRSAALSTALRQAYAKYPQAQSDIEALIMHDMDTQKDTSQELKSQARTNQRQDDIDVQLRDVARKQSNKISGLDDENDALSAELDKLSRELDSMHAQTGSAPERKKDTDSSSAKKSDTDTDRKDYGVNVRSGDRAEKSQQRAADAEKRKPEPEPEAPKLKPGSSTFKPVGSTLSTVPMIKPPAPTIDVIDRPDPSAAMSQVAQQLTNPPAPQPDIALPTSLKADPDEPEADTTQPDLFAEPEDNIKVDQPLPQSMSSMDAEPEPELPPNVTNLATRRNRMAEPGSDQYRRDTVAKAGELMRKQMAMQEAQDLRRMKKLAGLLQ